MYPSFALVVCIGLLLRQRRRPVPIIGAALASSLVFYLVTNFGVWAMGTLYPRTVAGLFECCAMAIPFFRNTVLGDAVYCAVLFGGFALAQKEFPALRQPELRGVPAR